MGIDMVTLKLSNFHEPKFDLLLDGHKKIVFS